jgi:hypothetical protein
LSSALKTFDPAPLQDAFIASGMSARMSEMKRVTGVKTTRITVETETRMIVCRAKATLSWCPYCRAEVDVITLDHESLVEPATAAQIHGWRNTGKLHLWQPTRGSAQICVTSLLQCFGRNTRSIEEKEDESE